MRKTAYLFVGLVALVATGCRKGTVEPRPEQKAIVEFSSKVDVSVNYTRADQNTFNGVIGAINPVDGWEFSPEDVRFDGLTGNASVAQPITTSPARVVVPVGDYKFVSCAVSGNGTLTPVGDNIDLVGGLQTADNDVVWASATAHVVNHNNEPFGVQLAYEHVFSAVRFELTCDAVADVNALMSEATIAGIENLKLPTSGTLNIRTGAITPSTTLLGDGASVVWKSNYLVTPGVSKAGELTVTYRGSEYKGTLPAKNFEAGQRLVISIKLNTSSLGFTATIKDWTEIIDDNLTLE